ncbi:MAG: AzlD domain-containing protein [Acidimicrobiia bacterium]|nr:AzlD domain-containing protein [Acidimicrobiia bacterium]
MIIFATFALAGIGTYAIRIAPILLGDHLLSSSSIESRIGLIAPAVLAAIVSSALLIGPHGARLPGIVELVVVGSAFAIVRHTGNVGLALAIGFPMYWIGALLGLT